MILKAFIYNIYNRIRVETFVQNTSQHRTEHPLTPNEAPISPPVATPKRNVGGRPSVDFNLVEALRLRDMGWSNRKIARKMNNVSKDTVRNRLMEYDAPHKSKPARAPSMPASPKPEPSPAAPAAPVTSKTVEQPPKPAAMPVAEPVRPSEPPPQPITNYDALVEYWRVRGQNDFRPDVSRFFLVNGAANVAFATGSEQFAYGIDSWHRDYRKLEVFQKAERIWVLLDAAEDNRAFLVSVAGDIWIHERCMVVRIERGSLLHVFQSRFGWHRTYPPQTYGVAVADKAFEESNRFIPMPQPNHVRELDALLEPPKASDVPQAIGGYGGYGYGGYGADRDLRPWLTPEEKRKIDGGDRGCGFAF
jgi:hypothetical protein